MKQFKYLLSVFIFFGFISCNNDDDVSVNQGISTTPTEFSQNFGNQISRTFLGTVVDINNNPIENVSITIGSLNALTDSNGVFIIQDASIYERFGYVTAEKIGYILGSRAVVPSTGTNKVTIMLLEETVAGTTNSGVSETISLSNGASVSFEGNYIKEDGSEYAGAVSVIMYHLDPTDENMNDQMPGMLYAENSAGEERMLQTFGMLAIELRGTNGEDLNLAEGTTAEITVPLDASLLATAPPTIPLWYFDEAQGYWIEDGEATLIGNEYVGTVSHFSFWNCDIPTDAVNLCVTVTDEERNALSNLWIALTSTDFGTQVGITNENGEVCGFVPSNETLIANIYKPDLCGFTAIHTTNVGSFSDDSSLVITIPDSDNLISETIIGRFETCDGNPVSEGYVGLFNSADNFLLSTEYVHDGNFELTTLRCESSSNIFRLRGADFVNTQETDTISFSYSSPITNIGTIVACNTVDEFFSYSVDDGSSVHFILEDFSTVLYETERNVVIYVGNPDVCIYLSGHVNMAPYIGTYGFNIFNDELGFNFNSVCVNELNAINSNVIFNLTEIGEVGEFIDLNFSGDYEGLDGIWHNIIGTFHVIRDE